MNSKVKLSLIRSTYFIIGCNYKDPKKEIHGRAGC